VQMLITVVLPRWSLERPPATQQLVGDDAQRVNVRGARSEPDGVAASRAITSELVLVGGF
jgi:hypothetical protein